MTEEEQKRLKKIALWASLFAAVGGLLYTVGKDTGESIFYWFN